MNPLTKEEIQEMIYDAIQNHLDNHNHQNLNDFIPMNQVAKSLHVTTNTLRNWENEGIIKSYKIGGRVYYERAEIYNCVKNSKL